MDHEVSEARKKITIAIGVVVFLGVLAIIVGSAVNAA